MPKNRRNLKSFNELELQKTRKRTNTYSLFLRLHFKRMPRNIVETIRGKQTLIPSTYFTYF